MSSHRETTEISKEPAASSAQADEFAGTGDTSHARVVPLPPAGQNASPVALRAVVPQSIAAALQLTDLLSARERTVFQLLGAGYDNRSIAKHLDVSERTVKRHVTIILAKLRLESRLQAGLASLIIASSDPEGTARPGR